MMSEGLSASDVALLNRDNDEWGNGSWIWLILILFFCGGNGFWGNNDRSATVGDVQRGFDTQDINNQLLSLAQIQNNAMYENAQLINRNTIETLNGFNQTQMAIMGTGDNIVNGITCGFDSTKAEITDNRYASQKGFCEVNENILKTQFENAQNTCAITNAIHQEGELTRGLINANVVQDLRDKLEEKDRLYQAANFQISQIAQTKNIVSELRPTPIPAYITASPYTSYIPYGYGYGTSVAVG